MSSRTIAFISVFAGILLFGISMVMIGSVLPLLKLRMGLSDIVAGGLFSILPLGLLIGSISFGPISDKYGYRWILSTASLFLAIGFIGIGHTSSLWLLRTCILFFGVVSYFTQQLQVEQREALIALSFSVLGMTLMRIITGGVFRNIKPKNLLHISFSFFIAGIICLLFQSLSSFYINAFGLFLIGAGLSSGFPVMLGLTGKIYKEVLGTAFSFVMLIALTGNIVINYITGILIEQYGIGVFVYVIKTPNNYDRLNKIVVGRYKR